MSQGGRPCESAKHTSVSLPEGSLADPAALRHSGNPARQEGEGTCFSLPAVSVILPQQGTAMGIGFTLWLFYALPGPASSQPSRMPLAAGSVLPLSYTFDLGRWGPLPLGGTSALGRHLCPREAPPSTDSTLSLEVRAQLPRPLCPVLRFRGPQPLPLVQQPRRWQLLPSYYLCSTSVLPCGFFTSPTSVSPSPLIQFSWWKYLGSPLSPD